MTKVLVVDDEAETVRMLSMAVQLLGFQPVVARSGETAISQANAESPDVVLLDLMMPDLDGMEVTRRLRANPQTAQTPIVIVTASPEADVEERCRQAGATAFMRKPVNMGDLFELLKKLAP